MSSGVNAAGLKSSAAAPEVAGLGSGGAVVEPMGSVLEEWGTWLVVTVMGSISEADALESGAMVETTIGWAL